MEKYIGLDLGTVTLGIATSDSLGFVHGLETFRFPKEAYSQARKRVHDLVAQTGIKNIVIGLPINMDGSQGFQSEYSLEFKKMLEDELHLPVIMQDERLTTRMAHSTMISADMSRKKRKENVDKIAATIILQSYLDSLPKY